MDPTLIRMVEFLNRERIRATYAAVGEAAGVPTRSVGKLLGDRCERASWVVNGRNGEPTGYTPIEKHPALYERSEIIRTGDELIRRMRTTQCSIPDDGRAADTWLPCSIPRPGKTRHVPVQLESADLFRKTPIRWET